MRGCTQPWQSSLICLSENDRNEEVSTHSMGILEDIRYTIKKRGENFKMRGNNMKSVVILGASNKPERYSYKAFQLLREQGCDVILVNPTLSEIEGVPVIASLDDIHKPVDIVSVYVRPQIAETLLYQLVDLKPGMVILNPGTESPKIEMFLERHCILYHKACTLVLAKTGRLPL